MRRLPVPHQRLCSLHHRLASAQSRDSHVPLLAPDDEHTPETNNIHDTRVILVQAVKLAETLEVDGMLLGECFWLRMCTNRHARTAREHKNIMPLGPSTGRVGAYQQAD